MNISSRDFTGISNMIPIQIKGEYLPCIRIGDALIILYHKNLCRRSFFELRFCASRGVNRNGANAAVCRFLIPDNESVFIGVRSLRFVCS